MSAQRALPLVCSRRVMHGITCHAEAALPSAAVELLPIYARHECRAHAVNLWAGVE